MSKPYSGETISQFAVRIENYLERWVELGKVEKTYEGLKDLIMREQILQQVSKPLALFLKERDPKKVSLLSELADKYEEAHTGNLGHNHYEQVRFEGRGNRQKQSHPNRGHAINRAASVVSRERCTFGRGYDRSGRSGVSSKPQLRNKKSDKNVMAGACMKKLNDCCINDNKITLSCGHKLPLMGAACNKQRKCCQRSNMPVSTGKVGDMKVSVLRDTGCSSVVVKSEFVKQNDYTGEKRCYVLIDGTVRKVPVANIDVDTPYFSGVVKALVMKNPVYDLILGNISGVKGAW